MGITTDLQPSSKRRGTKNVSTTHRSLAYPAFLFTMLATFAGVLIGVLAALSIVRTDVKSQTLAASAKLDSQIMRLSDMSINGTGLPATAGQCSTPVSNTTTAAAPAKVTQASSNQQGGQGGGMGGGTPAPGNSYVHSLVSGVFSNDNGNISNTGPDSSNSISFDTSNKTTITNNNNLNLTNTTSQSASSGDDSIAKNTTGGNADTGDATNMANTAIKYDVTN